MVNKIMLGMSEALPVLYFRIYDTCAQRVTWKPVGL